MLRDRCESSPFGLHTHALGGSSAAIDMGDNTLCVTGDPDDALDNRSAPRTVGGTCDAGAFESGAAGSISSGRITLSGTATGGTPGVSVVIAGVTVNVNTSNGESAATVAANVAAAINANAELQQIPIQAVAIGDSVLIDDRFGAGTGAPDPGLSVDSSDLAAVPMLAPAALAVLIATLPAVALFRIKRSRA